MYLKVNLNSRHLGLLTSECVEVLQHEDRVQFKYSYKHLHECNAVFAVCVCECRLAPLAHKRKALKEKQAKGKANPNPNPNSNSNSKQAARPVYHVIRPELTLASLAKLTPLTRSTVFLTKGGLSLSLSLAAARRQQSLSICLHFFPLLSSAESSETSRH